MAKDIVNNNKEWGITGTEARAERGTRQPVNASAPLSGSSPLKDATDDQPPQGIAESYRDPSVRYAKGDPIQGLLYKTSVQNPAEYNINTNADLIGVLKKEGLGIGGAKLSEYERHLRFARIPRIDPVNKIGHTHEFIFITKPDLVLYGDNSALTYSPLFREAKEKYPHVFNSLSKTQAYESPFIPLLSNYKRSNVDIPEISVSSDYETAKNMLGSSMFYRGPSYESDEAFEFSIEFEDNKYLEVYLWFRLYDEYERMKHYGLIEVPISNIQDRIIHDQMAMYKFIVADDGMSILHYSKFYGVYPKNVPRNIFSDMPDDGILKFTIQFKCSFVEDMDPSIIGDFKELTDNKGTPGDLAKGGFMEEFDGWSGEYMSRPRIFLPTDPEYIPVYKNKFYQLRWEG